MCSLSTMKAIRLAKVAMVTFFGLLAAVVVFGNVTDYGSNYNFVTHVLSMDTTFPGNTIMYRAITSTWIHHALYWLIIATEAVITILCLWGAYNMCKKLNASAEEFHQSKKIAIIAMVLSSALWFFGFQVVAGEWFGMWMSKWNGLPDATRLCLSIYATLIFISLKNDD